MNFMAMFEFGSNIALYLGMVCVIAVLFFFIKRQITETEKKLTNMMEIITGISMELSNLKTIAFMNSRGGGSAVGMETVKLDESMIISEGESEGESESESESESDGEGDSDGDSDCERESEGESDDDAEETNLKNDNDLNVITVSEDPTIKVEMAETQKTVNIKISSKLPTNVTDYSKFNMKKLKDFCIDKGISAEYSKLKKADLVKLLTDFDMEQVTTEDEEDEEDEEDQEEDEEEDQEDDEEEEQEDDVEEVEPGKQITDLEVNDTITISLETDAAKEVEIIIETDDFDELVKNEELAL
jgi:hypothetical protein